MTLWKASVLLQSSKVFYLFVGYKREASCAFGNLDFLDSNYCRFSGVPCAKYFSNFASLGLFLGEKILWMKGKHFLSNTVVVWSYYNVTP